VAKADTGPPVLEWPDSARKPLTSPAGPYDPHPEISPSRSDSLLPRTQTTASNEAGGLLTVTKGLSTHLSFRLQTHAILFERIFT